VVVPVGADQIGQQLGKTEARASSTEALLHDKKR
jgi:hypothetical protein